MIFQKKIRFIANIALACLEATSTGRCIIVHTHKYYKTQRKHQSLTILDISNKKKPNQQTKYTRATKTENKCSAKRLQPTHC